MFGAKRHLQISKCSMADELYRLVLSCLFPLSPRGPGTDPPYSKDGKGNYYRSYDMDREDPAEVLADPGLHETITEIF